MSIIRKGLSIVLIQRRNVVVVIVIYILLSSLFIWLGQIRTLIEYVRLDTSIIDRVQFLYKLIVSSVGALGVFSVVFTGIMLMILSLNITTFIVLYAKAKHLYGSTHIVATSMIGFLVSLMGVGCFSCGAFLLGYVLSLLGIGSIALLLPFHGVELIFLGIITLVISLYLLCKKLISLSV
jgi:hypothetical protein